MLTYSSVTLIDLHSISPLANGEPLLNEKAFGTSGQEGRQ